MVSLQKLQNQKRNEERRGFSASSVSLSVPQEPLTDCTLILWLNGGKDYQKVNLQRPRVNNENSFEQYVLYGKNKLSFKNLEIFEN